MIIESRKPQQMLWLFYFLRLLFILITTN